MGREEKGSIGTLSRNNYPLDIIYFGKRPTGGGKPDGYRWITKESMVSGYISNYVFENGIMPSGKHLFGTTKGYGYEIHEFEVDFDEVVLKAKS